MGGERDGWPPKQQGLTFGFARFSTALEPTIWPGFDLAQFPFEDRILQSLGHVWNNDGALRRLERRREAIRVWVRFSTKLRMTDMAKKEVHHCEK
jgi:hypothetical protein